MATLVYNRFLIPKLHLVTVPGNSFFVPDQAMTIQEIVSRATLGVLSDVPTLREIPDDMEEYYEDLTDGIIPRDDDFGDDFKDSDGNEFVPPR